MTPMRIMSSMPSPRSVWCIARRTARRHARDDRVSGHVLGHDGARADHGAVADRDAAQDGRVAADRGAAPDARRHDLPVGLGLQRCRRRWSRADGGR